ncbi:MAG: DUF4321 domain-containing protein [Gemmatimonadetes bacterium]|nr:DUF4321 domain-containing protein [Gemmatimonadota bacterium]MYH51979.1 DUF4321 domain-containing protein [Gemmatimonadota bacterium]MYK65778.1 DUF4321 domain-containing protein [Gemmatimonadota bacterium]
MESNNYRRNITRGLWTMVCGLCLGGLLTLLVDNFLWEGVPRSFLIASVEASLGPVSVDLVAVAFTIGPVSFALNVLTLVGIAIVALVVRSWL